MPIPVYATNCAGVIGGKVYVSGGVTRDKFFRNELQVYDPATNTWTLKAPSRSWAAPAQATISSSRRSTNPKAPLPSPDVRRPGIRPPHHREAPADDSPPWSLERRILSEAHFEFVGLSPTSPRCSMC